MISCSKVYLVLDW